MSALAAAASAFNGHRGAFILFEGVDRSGKSTQAGMLANYIASKQTSEFIRFPERTSVIGKLINSYLTSASNMSDETIHLLFSANRWEASKGIEEKLASGTTLICDRYAYSGVAFSSAKGIDLDWCKAPDIGLPAPDAIIFLDLTVEEAATRYHVLILYCSTVVKRCVSLPGEAMVKNGMKRLIFNQRYEESFWICGQKTRAKSHGIPSMPAKAFQN